MIKRLINLTAMFVLFAVMHKGYEGFQKEIDLPDIPSPSEILVSAKNYLVNIQVQYGGNSFLSDMNTESVNIESAKSILNEVASSNKVKKALEQIKESVN